MSRSFKDFEDAKESKAERKRKNLRNNGREAYKHFANMDNDDDHVTEVGFYRRPGRGMSGESSN
jgi:hypothetical protein